MEVEHVDFISMPVTDMQRATAWYRDTLGLPQTGEGGFPEFETSARPSPRRTAPTSHCACRTSTHFYGELLADPGDRHRRVSPSNATPRGLELDARLRDGLPTGPTRHDDWVEYQAGNDTFAPLTPGSFAGVTDPAGNRLLLHHGYVPHEQN